MKVPGVSPRTVLDCNRYSGIGPGLSHTTQIRLPSESILCLIETTLYLMPISMNAILGKEICSTSMDRLSKTAA